MKLGELALVIGVRENTLSQWETGARSPKVSFIPKITAALNCTADELLGIGPVGPAGPASCGEENKRRSEIC